MLRKTPQLQPLDVCNKVCGGGLRPFGESNIHFYWYRRHNVYMEVIHDVYFNYVVGSVGRKKAKSKGDGASWMQSWHHLSPNGIECPKNIQLSLIVSCCIRNSKNFYLHEVPPITCMMPAMKTSCWPFLALGKWCGCVDHKRLLLLHGFPYHGHACIGREKLRLNFMYQAIVLCLLRIQGRPVSHVFLQFVEWLSGCICDNSCDIFLVDLDTFQMLFKLLLIKGDLPGNVELYTVN